MGPGIGKEIAKGMVRLIALVGVLGLVVGLGIAYAVHKTNALDEPAWYTGCVDGGLSKEQCVKLLHERYKPRCT